MDGLKLWVLLLVVFMGGTKGWAQFGDPRERMSLSAAIDGGTNTDFTWRRSEHGERLAGGRMEQGVSVRVRSSVQLLSSKKVMLSLSPFYNFSNRKLCTEWGSERLNFTLPTEHHHYGGSLMLTYNLQAWGKPLTFIGVGTGNFSQYGYENASGMVGGMMAVTRNRSTFLGIGVIYLLGTSVTWPLYPLIIYSHKFDDHWSLSCMEAYNYLYYQVSPKVKCALGMELEADKFYFRPKTADLPKKAMLSQVSERVGLFADVQATKELTLSVGAGVDIPFYGRLRESGYNHNYMTLRGKTKPFVKMKAKFSLMRK